MLKCDLHILENVQCFLLFLDYPSQIKADLPVIHFQVLIGYFLPTELLQREQGKQDF